MRFPPPQKAHHWRAKLAERQQPPYEIVRKKIHGQWFDVKVYKPRWAQGDKREAEHLGLKDKEPNRFGRDRGDTLERKCKVNQGKS